MIRLLVLPSFGLAAAATLSMTAAATAAATATATAASAAASIAASGAASGATSAAASIATSASQSPGPINEVAGPLTVLDDDGGWCWFQGERAVIVDDTLLVGTVSTGGREAGRRGDINLLVHDLAAAETRTVELHDRLESDDHDSASITILPDGRVLTLYSRHGSDDLVRSRTSLTADPLGGWTDERSWSGRTEGRGVTYSNTFRLAGAGVLRNFYRGAGWDPAMIESADDGGTWSAPQSVLGGPGRPYLRYASNGRDAVHFAVSEQHPRNADTGIWHGSLVGDAVRNSQSVVVGQIGAGAPPSEALTQVFPGSPDAVAWCNDIRLDGAGHPVIVFNVQADGRGLRAGQGGMDHRYWYARYDGLGWRTSEFAFAGTRLYAGEDDYTGLATLDPRNPNIVYFSTDADPRTGAPLISRADGQQRHEIFQAIRTPDTSPDALPGAATWTFRPVTRNSAVDNIRPVVPVSHGDGPDDVGPNAQTTIVLWLRGDYRTYQDYDLAVVAADVTGNLSELQPAGNAGGGTRMGTFDAALNVPAIDAVAGAVAQWQMSNESRHPNWDWHEAAFAIGLVQWADTTDDAAIVAWAAERFAAMDYTLGPRIHMADDHAIGAAYQHLARITGDPSILAATHAGMRSFMEQPQNESLEWGRGIHDREWAWCDALFMAPPTLAATTEFTDDPAFMERADRLWWKTTDYLYNADDGLFHRDSRYFTQRDAGGRLIYWSRGNGWVIAGLVRMLEILPDDHPSRGRYIALLQEMSAALAACQREGGHWSSSLLGDPAPPTPESSGTAFFCFAMARGIREGWLDAATYMPVVERAWRSLVASVHEDGRIGWVQRAASAPGGAGPRETEVYATGGFLLAASEMRAMAAKN
ncbi:MAG: glycoside hydrolase family 88 protein [Phycisphaerales bacterium]